MFLWEAEFHLASGHMQMCKIKISVNVISEKEKVQNYMERRFLFNK